MVDYAGIDAPPERAGGEIKSNDFTSSIIDKGRRKNVKNMLSSSVQDFCKEVGKNSPKKF